MDSTTRLNRLIKPYFQRPFDFIAQPPMIYVAGDTSKARAGISENVITLLRSSDQVIR